MDNCRRNVLGILGATEMSHPFDDFLPQSWHQNREDRRAFRWGLVLVGIVVVATVAAYASTMAHWQSISQDQRSIAARWEDAQVRIQRYLMAEEKIRKKFEAAEDLGELLDKVPKSLLLHELTQAMPENSFLQSIRIDSRSRPNDEGVLESTGTIRLTGEAQSNALVSQFVEKLIRSNYFDKVALQYSQQKRGGELRDFAVNMEIRSSPSDSFTKVKP